MSKNCFLFSGQSSQYVGMAKEFYEKSPAVVEIFETAKSILGFDLYEICTSSDEATLAKTIYSQPAIFATSLAALEVATDSGITASAVAGHSLGEYAAMVACSMISIEDGFRLIKARSEAMQKCADNSSGAMCAILGLDAKEIEKVCEETDGYVVAVNYNSSAQTVIAGDSEAVDKAIETFTSMKAKAIKLKVASAFHSEIMRPAADEFYEAVKEMDINFREPTIDFYSNLNGAVLGDFNNMPEYLAKHIISPVRFTSELADMKENGYENYIELGPNKVLTGLVKKTLKGVTAVNIENLSTLDKALNSLFSE